MDCVLDLLDRQGHISPKSTTLSRSVANGLLKILSMTKLCQLKYFTRPPYATVYQSIIFAITVTVLIWICLIARDRSRPNRSPTGCQRFWVVTRLCKLNNFTRPLCTTVIRRSLCAFAVLMLSFVGFCFFFHFTSFRSGITQVQG